MKHLNALEHAIVGFFVGIVVSTYVLFVSGVGGYLGSVLSWVSLYPVVRLFSTSEIIVLIFITAVFVVYAILIGFLIKKNSKSLFVILPLVIVLAVAIFFQQETISQNNLEVAGIDMPNIANVVVPPKVSQQYFGTEAVGDLAGNGKNDVAFILSRNYSKTETMYYLAAALSVSNGHQGTNMLYLGDKVIPQNIAIKNRVIYVSYVKGSNTSTSTIFAKIDNGNIEFTASATY